METQYLNTADILVDDSRYSPKDYIFESFNAPTCHITSFDTLGILYPIIVCMDDRKRYHLVDGRKRIQFAKEMKQPMIKANVLAEPTPVTDIITLVFCNKRVAIETSTVNKVQFLYYAMLLHAADSWIVKALCVPFEFKPHSSFLRECERIYMLPRELRLFCHEKRFSLKQLTNLTYCPADIIAQILKWKSELQLTASILDEIASNLRDYLRRENRPVREFAMEEEVLDIFDSSLSAREKTEKLRLVIRQRKFPILSEKNTSIESVVESLHLPAGTRISWDRTLEIKNVSLSASLSNPSQWQEILDALSSDDVREAISRILDEL